MSKEITESFKELQTSKDVVSLPENCSCKNAASCLCLTQVSVKIKLQWVFFPAGWMCGDAAQAVLGHTRKFSHYFLTDVQYKQLVKRENNAKIVLQKSGLK